jgi:hypothetical protein
MELGATSEKKNTTFLLALALFYSAETTFILAKTKKKLVYSKHDTPPSIQSEQL